MDHPLHHCVSQLVIASYVTVVSVCSFPGYQHFWCVARFPSWCWYWCSCCCQQVSAVLSCRCCGCRVLRHTHAQLNTILDRTHGLEAVMFVDVNILKINKCNQYVWLHLTRAIRSVTSAVTNAILQDTFHKEGGEMVGCKLPKPQGRYVDSEFVCIFLVIASPWHATEWKSS